MSGEQLRNVTSSKRLGFVSVAKGALKRYEVDEAESLVPDPSDKSKKFVVIDDHSGLPKLLIGIEPLAEGRARIALDEVRYDGRPADPTMTERAVTMALRSCVEPSTLVLLDPEITDVNVAALEKTFKPTQHLGEYAAIAA